MVMFDGARTLLAIVAAVAASLVSQAAPRADDRAPLTAVRYVGEHGSGTLTVGAPQRGSQCFAISSVGSNAHVCSVAGVLREGIAKLRNEEGTCTVRFERTGDDVTVSSEGPGCRSYCGARAWFDGVYLAPDPRCTKREITQARSRHLAAYRKQAYAEAKAELEALLARCERRLDRFERIDVLNDLAVTLHRLGEDARCVELLTPWRAWARDEEPWTAEPSYAPVLEREAHAVSHNIAMCEGKPDPLGSGEAR